MFEAGLTRGRPPTGAAGIAHRLAELATLLRKYGVAVGTGEVIAAQRALAAIDPADRGQARIALRSALCSSRSDQAAFEAALADWVGQATQAAPQPLLDPVATVVLPRVAVPGSAPVESLPAEGELKPAAWSSVELLRNKDFAEYEEAERALARAIMRRIAARGASKVSRRTRPSRRPSHRLDTRATLRASLRHAGEPLERHWRQPLKRPRPLVLVLDVSGSMEPYSRMLLQYAQACVASRRRCEAFAFGTRLTRVTRELRGRDPNLALERAAERVTDWSGGTRIGDALAVLNRVHGSHVGRGAVVVILSDGWDCGDPALLQAEIARLHRCAHLLLWLNPLKANPDYEPLTRGMVAALPHVDALLAGNNLSSLARLADLIETGMANREIGAAESMRAGDSKGER